MQRLKNYIARRRQPAPLPAADVAEVQVQEKKGKSKAVGKKVSARSPKPQVFYAYGPNQGQVGQGMVARQRTLFDRLRGRTAYEQVVKIESPRPILKAGKNEELQPAQQASRQDQTSPGKITRTRSVEFGSQREVRHVGDHVTVLEDQLKGLSSEPAVPLSPGTPLPKRNQVAGDGQAAASQPMTSCPPVVAGPVNIPHSRMSYSYSSGMASQDDSYNTPVQSSFPDAGLFSVSSAEGFFGKGHNTATQESDGSLVMAGAAAEDKDATLKSERRTPFLGSAMFAEVLPPGYHGSSSDTDSCGSQVGPDDYDTHLPPFNALWSQPLVSHPQAWQKYTSEVHLHTLSPASPATGDPIQDGHTQDSHLLASQPVDYVYHASQPAPHSAEYAAASPVTHHQPGKKTKRSAANRRHRRASGDSGRGRGGRIERQFHMSGDYFTAPPGPLPQTTALSLSSGNLWEDPAVVNSPRPAGRTRHRLRQTWFEDHNSAFGQIGTGYSVAANRGRHRGWNRGRRGSTPGQGNEQLRSDPLIQELRDGARFRSQMDLKDYLPVKPEVYSRQSSGDSSRQPSGSYSRSRHGSGESGMRYSDSYSNSRQGSSQSVSSASQRSRLSTPLHTPDALPDTQQVFFPPPTIGEIQAGQRRSETQL